MNFKYSGIIAIIEFAIICFFVWTVYLEPSEKVDLSTYNNLKSQYEKDHLERVKEQQANSQLIKKLQIDRDSLNLVISNNNEKIESNDKVTTARVNVIRSASLDSVASIFAGQQASRPEGY